LLSYQKKPLLDTPAFVAIFTVWHLLPLMYPKTARKVGVSSTLFLGVVARWIFNVFSNFHSI